MLRDIATDAAANALGRRPAELRDWRGAWFLTGVGERVGKVTMYSRGEIGMIAIAIFLNGCGFKMGAAFAIARAHARQIQEAAAPNATSPQTLFVRIDSKITDGYSASAAPSNGVGAETAGNAQAVIGLNLKRIVDDALTRLKDDSRKNTKAA